MAKIGEGTQDQGGQPPKGMIAQMLDSALDLAQQGWEDLYIGEGSLGSAGRLGLAELEERCESVAREYRCFPRPGHVRQPHAWGNLSGAGIQQESVSMGDLRNAAEEKTQEQGKDGPDQDRGGIEL